MSKKTFIITGAIFFVLRILAGRLMGAIFWPQLGDDDLLMIRYADLNDHFIAQTPPYIDLLVKNMGFPVFLDLLKVTGVNYIDAMSLIWFLSAIAFTFLFATLTQFRRREIWLCVYVFVLFTPIAFSYVGVRVYRNSALAPFYFLVITLMANIFVVYWKNLELSLKKRMVFSVVFGVLFSWTYYMKEDGIWLLMCLVAMIILCLIHKYFLENQSVKEKFVHTLILILPLVIWFSCTEFYKGVNEHYFGVKIINNRTEGELGNFLKNVHKIKSDERSFLFWAPTDAIMKAFDVSETLKNNDALKDAVIHTPWITNKDAPTIFDRQIPGDFFGWVMLTAIYETKTCSSLAEQEAYLKKVNQELETAFESGVLEKDNRFYLTYSMGGLTFDELLNLRIGIIVTFRSFLTLDAYEKISIPAEKTYYLPDVNDKADIEEKNLRFKSIIEIAGEFTNIDYFEKNKYIDEANIFASSMFKIYGVFNCIMFTLAFGGLFLTLKKIKETSVKNCADIALIAVIVIGSLLLAVVYSLAISWYSAYMNPANVWGAPFYGIGIIPFLAVFEVFGTYLFLNSFKSIRKYWYIEK